MVSRSEKAVFSTIFCLEWRGWVITHKDKLAHSPGLQYVSNLLRTILHAAQVTNIASDLVKIATQERFLVLLDDQKPGVCNLLGIDSNRRCRGW